MKDETKKLLDAFDEASQNYGLMVDQGSAKDLREATLLYDEAKAALAACIEELSAQLAQAKADADHFARQL